MLQEADPMTQTVKRKNGQGQDEEHVKETRGGVEVGATDKYLSPL